MFLWQFWRLQGDIFLQLTLNVPFEFFILVLHDDMNLNEKKHKIDDVAAIFSSQLFIFKIV